LAWRKRSVQKTQKLFFLQNPNRFTNPGDVKSVGDHVLIEISLDFIGLLEVGKIENKRFCTLAKTTGICRQYQSRGNNRAARLHRAGIVAAVLAI
jgi:hypothetical protein